MPVNIDIAVLFEFIFFSILFVLFALLISFILRYKSKNKELETTYECGLEVFEDAKIRFQPRFFTYALCFLLFEAECVLMFPFALIAKALDLFYLIEIMIFILLVIFALLYGIKSGLVNSEKNPEREAK